MLKACIWGRICIFVLLAFSLPVAASTIEATTYRSLPAYRLSDGKTEAVVVPKLGRVMSFSQVGGENWLWNLSENEIHASPHPYRNWRNWGGDKTWLASQSDWPALAGRDWPPDIAWGDPAAPFKSEVLVGGALRLTGPVSAVSGTRIVRNFQFKNGEFIIGQTVQKLRGQPLMASIWSVTGIVRPDATYLPRPQQSAYSRGFHVFGGPHEGSVPTPDVTQREAMLVVRPSRGTNYKIGVDSPVATIAAQRGNWLFLQRAARPPGDYPDGAVEAGFPVELYDTGTTTETQFCELELLSPLHLFRIGTQWTHTVTWSIRPMPTDDDGVAALLSKPQPKPTKLQ